MLVHSPCTWLRSAHWLRLVVTALLCLAGVTRPPAARSDAVGSCGRSEPMHITASAGRGELVRVGQRNDEPTSESTAVIEAFEQAIALESTLVDLHAPQGTRPSDASPERARARGPPVA